jgi:serine O-acetyltransferase
MNKKNQKPAPTPAQIWETLKKEAEKTAKKEPLVSTMVHTRILGLRSLAESLSQILALQLGDHNVSALQLQNLFLEVLTSKDSIIKAVVADIHAVFERDPACTNYLEPYLFLKGFHALQTHRIAHELWKQDRKLLAQVLQSASNRVFAVDIHPAAEIGKGIMVDHATALVIGETAKIGNNVSILHGVTLGGTGKDAGDRHPKVADGVLLSAHAQLLGNIKIGRCSKIGANSVVLGDVPARTTWAGVPAKNVGVPASARPSLDMRVDFDYDESE